MKSFIKHFLLILIIISTFILIDYNVYFSNAETVSFSVPTSINVKKSTDTSIELSWNKVNNIASYEIYLKNGNNYTLINSLKDSSATTWVHENLTPNNEYTYVIKTKNNEGLESQYSDWVSIYLGDQNAKYTNIEKLTLNNVPSQLNTNKTINLFSFIEINKENTDLDLYNKTIRWYSSDNSIATIDNNGILKAKKPGKVIIKALGHNGINDYFMISIVQTKKSNNNHSVVLTNVINAPSNVKATRISSKKVKLTWNKVKGAMKYEIYLKKRNKYHKIATVNKTKYIVKKLKKNKQYYFKIKTVKKIKGNTYRSSFSNYVSCYTNSKNSKYTNVNNIKFLANPKVVMEKNKINLKYVIVKERHNKKLKNKKIRWWSSNKNVAIVNKYGKVETKNSGEVIIYAKAHNGVIAKYKLTVDSKYANKIPILTFHRIVSAENKKTRHSNDQWVASVSDFEKQMKYLYNNNYKTISASEFENWYYKRIEYPKKTVMLTFDDGDYEFYYLVVPVLKKYNFKATAFIIGSYTGNFTTSLKDEGRYRIGKDAINKISYEYPNIDFQSHSYNLHYRDSEGKAIATTKSYQELMNDFDSNSSFNFKYLAYPFGARTPELIKAAQDSGIRLAFKFGTDTYATRNDYKYEISRVKINGQITYDKYVKKMKGYLK